MAIYTRNAICAPIRAEEGITGVLKSPNSSKSFCNLPVELQIGGYPTKNQLSNSPLDASVLDSEGRCVILEFPAFVLIGTYCPAARDESRDEYRVGFLNALDARVRNLVSAGKRVLLAGDLNIIREEIDTAYAKQLVNKQGYSHEEFISCPARRILNQLLVDGEVFGERDEGREQPIMWDLCRIFHSVRSMMFTCWDQKINARPGNFGSRIDYILCSEGWKNWFFESNIQEGLMGSDHCPVYAVLKQVVDIEGKKTDIRDVMSPGMFKDGIRQREWSISDLLPLSVKLLPEFDRRRNIKDMFSRKTSCSLEAQKVNKVKVEVTTDSSSLDAPITENKDRAVSIMSIKNQEHEGSSKLKSETLNEAVPMKRNRRNSPNSLENYHKRFKTPALNPNNGKKKLPKQQSSLVRFFERKEPETDNKIKDSNQSLMSETGAGKVDMSDLAAVSKTSDSDGNIAHSHHVLETCEEVSRSANISGSDTSASRNTMKKNWSELLTHRVPPRCYHDEPCISHVTKKIGINCGRTFFMCARPLGPSGMKEKNTEWRCGTFIWSSDWKADL